KWAKNRVPKNYFQKIFVVIDPLLTHSRTCAKVRERSRMFANPREASRRGILSSFLACLKLGRCNPIACSIFVQAGKDPISEDFPK
ncbi:MAG TPA: hypothetical protein VIF60_06985, partial [Burkholderiaceae bacterium]